MTNDDRRVMMINLIAEKYNHVYNISFGNFMAFLEIKDWVSAEIPHY